MKSTNHSLLGQPLLKCIHIGEFTMHLLTLSRTLWRFTIAIFMGLLILTTSNTAVAASTQNNTNSRTTISGHMVTTLHGIPPFDVMDDNSILSVSISLKLRNSQELDALLNAQNDSTSPLYHQYLPSGKFTELFGPLPSTVDAISRYLEEQGLKVGDIAPNRLTIEASGTVASIQKAFSVQLAKYKLGLRVVYAPTKEPSVPTELSPYIQGINGLDNVVVPHLMGESNSTANAAGSGPSGGYTPYELRMGYNIRSLTNLGYTGKGQTIGIFSMSNYKVSDINQYRSYYGLGPVNIRNTYIDGIDSSFADDGAIEMALDIDVVSAIAPDAAIEIYMGPPDPNMVGINTPGFQHFTNIWQRIVNDNTAKVISTSWGDCEPHFSSNELTTLNNIFKQGAVQGQTAFAAAGNEGPYDCQYGDTTVSVDYPASDPYVVGVGGTNLYLNSNSTYNYETIWYCPTCTGSVQRPNGLASGGGYSMFFPRPSYQVGQGVNTSAGAMRQVPDVSATASGSTPYSI
jgi:subtilase family serine protease